MIAGVRRYVVVGAPSWAEAAITLGGLLSPVKTKTFDADQGRSRTGLGESRLKNIATRLQDARHDATNGEKVQSGRSGGDQNIVISLNYSSWLSSCDPTIAR